MEDNPSMEHEFGCERPVMEAGTSQSLDNVETEVRWREKSWSVIGVGSAGCNMVQSFAKVGLSGNGCYIFLDSESVALAHHARTEGGQGGKTNTQFHLLGQSGYGMGSNSDLGRSATIAVTGDLLPAIAESDIVFVLAGLGGGTGSGGAPVIAATAKSYGAFVVALVTLPFEFEGQYPRTNAIESLEELRGIADQIAILELHGLFASKHYNSPQDVAFNAVDLAMIAYANRVCVGRTMAPETWITL